MQKLKRQRRQIVLDLPQLWCTGAELKMNRRTFIVMVNNQPRWEIKAYTGVEAIQLAKTEHDYPEGPGITISAQAKPRKQRT
jgi:hypothetical protein